MRGAAAEPGARGRAGGRGLVCGVVRSRPHRRFCPVRGACRSSASPRVDRCVKHRAGTATLRPRSQQGCCSHRGLLRCRAPATSHHRERRRIACDAAGRIALGSGLRLHHIELSTGPVGPRLRLSHSHLERPRTAGIRLFWGIRLRRINPPEGGSPSSGSASGGSERTRPPSSVATSWRGR